jgi:biotin carboxyl carrier protein
VKLEVEIGGKTRTVEFSRIGERLSWAIDGKAVEADAVEVSAGVYSILIDGQSFEARIEPAPKGVRVVVAGREYSASVRDPRQWKRHGGAAREAEGRQQVLAPMPGKIIRILVKAGEPVAAGQGLLVIEAMKMQNEVRSPKSGTVERLLVNEGQTVTAAEILAIVS